jgi:hypothetical protein
VVVKVERSVRSRVRWIERMKGRNTYEEKRSRIKYSAVHVTTLHYTTPQ